MILSWLAADNDPLSVKHRGSWIHPIVSCFVHYIISAATIIYVHDFIILPLLLSSNQSNGNDLDDSRLGCSDSWSSERDWCAKVSLIYVLILLITRLTTNDKGVHRLSVLYEFTWLCNSALVFGSFALLTCRPLIAAGFAVAVSIDQILWWVDVLYFIISGFKTFPIGVCKYIFWPQTQWATKITCTHHFWTIPLLLYGCGGVHMIGSYSFNVLIVLLHVLLSRFLTPFKLSLNDDSKEIKYLNVNLSYELWSDIKIKLLRRSVDNKPIFMYIFRLNLWWQLFNFACVLILCFLDSVCRFVSGVSSEYR